MKTKLSILFTFFVSFAFAQNKIDVITSSQANIRLKNSSGAADSNSLKLKKDTICLGHGETNYLAVENDGTIIFRGASTVWEDDNLDPTTLTGGGVQPSRISWTGTGLSIAGFNPSTVDEVEGAREIPHRAKLGSPIYFHCHYAPDNNNTDSLRFGLEYFFTMEGVAVSSSTTIYVMSKPSGTAWAKQTAVFPSILPPANELGMQFHFRFFRDATSIRDAFTGNAAVSTIGYHYEIDAIGSHTGTVK